MLLFVTVYPPGNHTMVILKAPAEVHPGPLQVKSGSHRLPPGYRTGGGVQVPCVLSLKNCPRFAGGSRQGPRRAPVGLFTGLIRGIFPAGAGLL